MSIRAIDLVFKHATRVDKQTLLVLLALADYADDTGFCFPTMSALALKTRVSARHLTRIIAALEAAGFIEVERGNGRGHGSKFRVFPRGKGDITDTLYPVKGDIGVTLYETIKGDTHGTLLEIKGDKTCIENTVKGDKTCIAYKAEPSLRGINLLNESVARTEPEPPSWRVSEQFAAVENALGVAPMKGLLNPRILMKMQAVTERFIADGVTADEINLAMRGWTLPTPPTIDQFIERIGGLLEATKRNDEQPDNRPRGNGSGAYQANAASAALASRLEMVRKYGAPVG